MNFSYQSFHRVKGLTFRYNTINEDNDRVLKLIIIVKLSDSSEAEIDINLFPAENVGLSEDLPLNYEIFQDLGE
jgi:hypothetical protein